MCKQFLCGCVGGEAGKKCSTYIGMQDEEPNGASRSSKSSGQLLREAKGRHFNAALFYTCFT